MFLDIIRGYIDKKIIKEYCDYVEEPEKNELKKNRPKSVYDNIYDLLDVDENQKANLINHFNENGETIKNIDDSLYKISQKEAFKIANLDENLKSDFVKNVKDNISYLSFRKYATDIVTINNKKYWNVRILEADFSITELDSYETIFSDGTYTEKDSREELNKMSCLIDVDTGEYKYYSL